MAANYSQIFQTRSYLDAGTFNHPEPSPELLSLIARVVDKLPEDQRARFRTEVEKYQTYENLPAHLKAQLPTPGYDDDGNEIE